MSFWKVVTLCAVTEPNFSVPTNCRTDDCAPFDGGAAVYINRHGSAAGGETAAVGGPFDETRGTNRTGERVVADAFQHAAVEAELAVRGQSRGIRSPDGPGGNGRRCLELFAPVKRQRVGARFRDAHVGYLGVVLPMMPEMTA